jgi:hypothetical protein
MDTSESNVLFSEKALVYGYEMTLHIDRRNLLQFLVFMYAFGCILWITLHTSLSMVTVYSLLTPLLLWLIVSSTDYFIKNFHPFVTIFKPEPKHKEKNSPSSRS